MKTYPLGGPRVLLAGLALLFGVALTTATSAPSNDARTQATASVKITLGTAAKPFALIPSARSAAAGKVTFVVTNKSTMTHEFVVLKTKLGAAKLPVKGGKASEAGRVGEISQIGAGQTKRLTITMKAGHHVLLCNFAGHYQGGQRADFTIR